MERLSEFKTGLEARGLRFSYLDGQVEGICPNQEDAVWILNIKRGILSSLQNNMDALDTDKRVFEVGTPCFISVYDIMYFDKTIS